MMMLMSSIVSSYHGRLARGGSLGTADTAVLRQYLLQARLGQQQRSVPQDVPGVELRDGGQRSTVDVAGGSLDVLVAAGEREQAAPVDPQRLEQLGHVLGLGLGELDLVQHADVL